MESDPLQTQLAIQALQLGQKEDRKILNKVSDSLDQLVSMQKAHEAFHATVTEKLEAQITEDKHLDKRLSKIESNQSWAVRLVLAAILAKVIHLIWGS